MRQHLCDRADRADRHAEARNLDQPAVAGHDAAEPTRREVQRSGFDRRQRAIDQGVHVSSIELDQSELSKRWEPTSPYAQPPGTPDAGYVYYPNIDPATEMVDGLDAQRAYEANIAAAEATKAIVAQALRLLS